jgi:hypothetical protein
MALAKRAQQSVPGGGSKGRRGLGCRPQDQAASLTIVGMSVVAKLLLSNRAAAPKL